MINLIKKIEKLLFLHLKVESPTLFFLENRFLRQILAPTRPSVHNFKNERTMHKIEIFS